MSLPAPLSSFLQQALVAWKARSDDPISLAALVCPPQGEYTDIQDALRQLGSSVDLSQLVARHASIPAAERANAFVAALLGYISQCPHVHEQGLSAGMSRSAYDKWADVYSKASLVFQAQETPFFGPTLRQVGKVLLQLAFSSDDSSKDFSRPCITDAVSRISRTTGVAAIDRSPLPGNATKRAEVLWLANASFRCYFKLKNVRLCETVLGSVENALTLNRNFASEEQKTGSTDEDAGMSFYSRADRVTYRYYLGRLRLSQHRIRKAHTELRWAFDNCTNANMHNKRLLMIHLVVASLILGILPARSLLASAALDGPFGQLVEHIRRGNGAQMHVELDKWRDWHRQRGNYLLLKEKLPIGVWRNLMRRCFLVARAASGLGPPDFAPLQPGNPIKTPPPTLKLSSFLIMARKAWADDTLELDDVECVTASLIDQDYVKGYVLHSSGNVVLRRAADFGFVKMSTVY